MNKPFERCYWAVKGRLLAGCYPGHEDNEEADLKLAGLLNAGVVTVINLMEEDEAN